MMVFYSPPLLFGEAIVSLAAFFLSRISLCALASVFEGWLRQPPKFRVLFRVREVSIETLKRTLFLGVPRMKFFFILSKNKNKALTSKQTTFLNKSSCLLRIPKTYRRTWTKSTSSRTAATMRTLTWVRFFDSSSASTSCRFLFSFCLCWVIIP